MRTGAGRVRRSGRDVPLGGRWHRPSASERPRRAWLGPPDAQLVGRKGYFAADRLRIPLYGAWTMKVTVSLTDVDQVTVAKDVTMRPTQT